MPLIIPHAGLLTVNKNPLCSTLLISLIDRLRIGKSCLRSAGIMAGEQYRIIGVTHASANLRMYSAGVDNLRSFFAKKDRRTHFLKIPSIRLAHFAFLANV